jgi:hypothetical protein
MPFIPITDNEIDEAISGASSKSAAGFSQISYKAVKLSWAAPEGKRYICKLIQKCAESGYHPRAWRRAVAIALRKPGKPDYSNPRAYRLITLLECLGKVLEKVIARRLTFLAGKYDLVPSNQFGGRSHSSTSDALLSFVNDVHAAWNHSQVTSALTFDIKGYFDFVNHKRLLTVLRKKGIPLPIVTWVASFLDDRQAAVCLDGIRGNMAEVENGIPQGSPVSPILAAFYTSDIFNLFLPNPIQSTPVPDKPTAVTLFMYVDDGKLTVSSRSLETNVIYLKSACNKVDEWLHQAGLSPDYAKRELMHYTRRKKDGSPSITFDDRDGKRRVICPESHVRWLGVHFDRKLRFTHHIKLAAAKGTNAVCALAMLANTVRGLHQTQLRHLYIACVLPKILYAAPVWANGKANQLKPLEKVQRRALLHMCAAFRTTPTIALEVEASLPPLHIQIKQIKAQFAIRLNKLPPSSPVLQRLGNHWRKGKKPKFPPLSHQNYSTIRQWTTIDPPLSWTLKNSPPIPTNGRFPSTPRPGDEQCHLSKTESESSPTATTQTQTRTQQKPTTHCSTRLRTHPEISSLTPTGRTHYTRAFRELGLPWSYTTKTKKLKRNKWASEETQRSTTPRWPAL